ncbi:Crp/Fnr family transcriptional regulator [Novispirillum sp. DQ9]|uniref:Crp/Fnr family transcriptional regulator n=1 Tax=Novispirillum sp. DQ9 TaxID=3398612 RepID=UPI003C7B3AC4
MRSLARASVATAVPPALAEPTAQACRRMARCRSCTVRRNALFVNLTHEELDQIAPSVPDLTLSAGQPLYREGDRPNALFIIRRGVVKLEQYLPDGTYRIVRLARRTDLLALESLLETACDHTAIALTEVEVCRVPLPVVRLVMAKQDWLATQMIRHWHHAVQRADDWLTHYSTGTGRQRIARLLIDLHDLAEMDAEEQEEAGPPLVELPSRDDVGAIVGITKETASRVVADFRRAGLLRNEGARHMTIDRAALAAIAAKDA